MMVTWKRRYAAWSWLVLSISLLLLIAAACGQTASPSAPTAPAATLAPTAPAATLAPAEATNPPAAASAGGGSQAPVATAATRPDLSGELTIQTWRDIAADPNHPSYTLYQLMKQWEANHPKVKVTYQPMLGTVADLFAYITTNIRSQTLGDVVMMYFPSPAQLDPDRLYDLSGDLAKPNPYSTNPTWKDDFPLDGIALKDVTLADGKVLMVGTTYTGDLGDAAILYNQDLLERAGIKTLPKTWDEFMADLARLKAAGIQPFYNPTAGNEAYVVSWEMGILGDQLLGDVIAACDGQAGGQADGRIMPNEAAWCVKKGKWSASAPGVRALFERMKDWSQYWHDGYLAPPAPGDLFIQGKVAFRWIVRINMPFIESDPNVRFRWGSFYLPPLKGTAGTPEGQVRRYGNAGAGSGSQYLFIPKTTVDHGRLDLALDLLQYITSPESLVYWCSIQTVPCYKPGTPINQIFPNDPLMQERYRGFLEPPALNNRVSGLDVSNAFGPAVSVQETQVLQDYLAGKSDLDQTLQAYQKLLDQLADNLIRQHPEWKAEAW